MMTNNISIISAAIQTLADRAIEEQNVGHSDHDTMSKIMWEAQSQVANQLAREGMALKDALEITEEASTAHGRETTESNELAERAYRNRHSDVPEHKAQNVSSGHDVSTPAEAAIEALNVEAATNGDPRAESDVLTAPRPAAQQAPAIGTAPVATSTAPVTAPALLPPTAFLSEAPREMLEYDVKWLRVPEIFKAIDDSDLLFDFKLPFIDWKGQHGGVPKIDPAYNMDMGDLLSMLYAVANRTSTILVGPHGCGKTEFVAQIAGRLNFPLVVLPMDGQLSRSQLIGQQRLTSTAHGPRTYFAEGILPRGMAEPGFLLFDEVDRGVSDLQYACHSVYLGEGLTLLEDDGRYIPCHEYNRVFGTANTKGRGSFDGMYQAREEQSEATRDRWSNWIEMGYQSVDDDKAVLRAKIGQTRMTDQERHVVAQLANLIREAFLDARLSQTCSMRQQLQVAHKFAFFAERERDDDRRAKLLKFAIDRIICGRASEEDKGAIQTMVQTLLPTAFEGDPIV